MFSFRQNNVKIRRVYSSFGIDTNFANWTIKLTVEKKLTHILLQKTSRYCLKHYMYLFSKEFFCGNLGFWKKDELFWVLMQFCTFYWHFFFRNTVFWRFLPTFLVGLYYEVGRASCPSFKQENENLTRFFKIPLLMKFSNFLMRNQKDNTGPKRVKQ